jgi:DNA-binding response OmpR family regulator
MKILFIEDDSSIRNVLRISLESEGHTIDEAVDGAQGSYLARTNEYDLIILDNNLPKKGGKQVCLEIRNENIHTPILMLSAKAEITEKVALFELGADDYVTKPFSYEELTSRIQALIRRPSRIESTIYKFKDLILNSDTCEVSRSDRRIYLTRKEFSLLELLMKNNDKVMSRGSIMDHVWDLNMDPFSNTLETHIMNIRKKIGDTKKNRIIQNVPGRGYKINCS